METDNRFMVAVAGNQILILRPPPQRMSKDDALNLAAWLVALTDDDDDTFHSLLEQVCNT